MRAISARALEKKPMRSLEDFIGNPNINLVPVNVREAGEKELVLALGAHTLTFAAREAVQTKTGDKLLLKASDLSMSPSIRRALLRRKSTLPFRAVWKPL